MTARFSLNAEDPSTVKVVDKRGKIKRTIAEFDPEYIDLARDMVYRLEVRHLASQGPGRL